MAVDPGKQSVIMAFKGQLVSAVKGTGTHANLLYYVHSEVRGQGHNQTMYCQISTVVGIRMPPLIIVGTELVCPSVVG